MSDQLVSIAPWIAFAVLALLIWLWRRYGSATEISALVESVVPDEFDDVAEYLVSLAVSVVDQRIKAYEALTNAERLALAKKYAAALLDYSGRNLSDVAMEALIEEELWLRHQVTDEPVREVNIADTPPKPAEGWQAVTTSAYVPPEMTTPEWAPGDGPNKEVSAEILAELKP
jgi:hypothetical protein